MMIDTFLLYVAMIDNLSLVNDDVDNVLGLIHWSDCLIGRVIDPIISTLYLIEPLW